MLNLYSKLRFESSVGNAPFMLYYKSREHYTQVGE